MRFALLSTVGRLGAPELDRIAVACNAALPAVAAAWAPVFPDVAFEGVRTVTSRNQLGDGDVPGLFVPAFAPEDAGDLALHYIQRGLPYFLVLADPLQPLRSMQQAAWHEMAEALVDPNCARYDDDGFAIEVCDPCQVDEVVGVGGVLLSPFVLPEWFRIRGISGSPCDSADLLQRGHSVRPGGYAMRQDGTELSAPGYQHAPEKLGYHSRRSKRRRALGLA